MPIRPICNLCCRYYFYLEKELLYGPGESWRMPEERLVLEHNGDFYGCDHFVDPPHKLDSIDESIIARMANSQAQQQFEFAKSTALPSSCDNCEVRFLCNGDCPKDRFCEMRKSSRD